MSEVSLRAAYGAYKKYRASEQLSELYGSVVKGQAEAGHEITHIYSLIDDLNDVQLFYCGGSEHRNLMETPYARKRKLKLALVWREGSVHGAPAYLKRAYAELLRSKGVAEGTIATLGLRPWWRFW